MKVLVLHQFVNHNQLVDALCENLNKQEVETDSFNISTWQFNSLKSTLPLHIIVLKKILFHYKLKLLFLKLFPSILKSLFTQYTIIDIHFFGTFYFKIILLLNKINKKVKITIWGSDFYRANNCVREKQKLYYNKVDSIQIATEQMKLDFLEYFKDFDEKIRLAHFGIFQFESITKISNKETIEISKEKLNLPTNKLIITCGSNGIKEQQHITIFEAVNLLTKQEKENVFLLVPMTNGHNETYKKILEDKLNATGVDYKILITKLSVEDVCRLRLATDITVNIQVSDAFSASLQEHLFSKNVVIVGDWLPYNKLEENDIFYIKISLEDLNYNLKNVVNNYASFFNKTKENKNKIYNMSSWDAVTKDWIKIYTEIS